jgi:hypothetical protein
MLDFDDCFPYHRFPVEAEGFVSGAVFCSRPCASAPRAVLPRCLHRLGVSATLAAAKPTSAHPMYTKGCVITLDGFLQLLARMPLLENLSTEQVVVEPADPFDELNALSYAGMTLHQLRQLEVSESTLVTLVCRPLPSIVCTSVLTWAGLRLTILRHALACFSARMSTRWLRGSRAPKWRFFSQGLRWSRTTGLAYRLDGNGYTFPLAADWRRSHLAPR